MLLQVTAPALALTVTPVMDLSPGMVVGFFAPGGRTPANLLTTATVQSVDMVPVYRVSRYARPAGDGAVLRRSCLIVRRYGHGLRGRRSLTGLLLCRGHVSLRARPWRNRSNGADMITEQAAPLAPGR